MFPDVMLNSEFINQKLDYITVWLKIYDSSISNSKFLRDELKRCVNDIKGGEKILDRLMNKGNGVIVAIESQHPLALLMVQQHLMGRFELSCSKLKPQEEMNQNDLPKACLSKKNTKVSLNSSLSKFLKDLRSKHDSRIRKEFEQMKEELNLSFYKLYLSSTAILSYSKRLPDLPENVCSYFETMVALNKKHQLRLVEVLNSLEMLKRLDKQYSKIPDLELTNHMEGIGNCDITRFSLMIN